MLGRNKGYLMHKLNNNHNVYILGAGFSAARGLPTIKDFMLTMRDAHLWLDSQGRKEEAEAIASVLDFRLNAASAAYRVKLDLENIEELFSLASASSRTLTKQIQLAISSTLDFKLRTTPSPTVSFQSEKLSEAWPSEWAKKDYKDIMPLSPYEINCPAYEFFLTSLIGNWNNSSNHSENSFISFNYDLLVEDALKKLSIPFTYGFDSKQNDADVIEILKLHGSVNWARKEKSTTNYTIYDSYEDLRSKRQTPQLVPPTWRKIFTGPLRQVWDRSLKSLESATRIIVIGFSIPATDNHFKYLMAAGLQNNISLREIIFVNPDSSGSLELRAKALFGDVSRLGNAAWSSSNPYIIGANLSSFLEQGPYSIARCGRPIPREIQNIQFHP
jgi:hypothetical protein